MTTRRDVASLTQYGLVAVCNYDYKTQRRFRVTDKRLRVFFDTDTCLDYSVDLLPYDVYLIPHADSQSLKAINKRMSFYGYKCKALLFECSNKNIIDNCWKVCES